MDNSVLFCFTPLLSIIRYWLCVGHFIWCKSLVPANPKTFPSVSWMSHCFINEFSKQFTLLGNTTQS